VIIFFAGFSPMMLIKLKFPNSVFQANETQKPRISTFLGKISTVQTDHMKIWPSCVFITEMKRIATRLENQPIEETNCASSLCMLSQERCYGCSQRALGNGKASSFPEARARSPPSGTIKHCVVCVLIMIIL
jgi:hypothetical protein